MALRSVFVLTLVALIASAAIALFPKSEAQAAVCQAPTSGPYVTLTPSGGQPGTVVSVNLFQFAPNDTVSVILRVAGNPVVATGTTDAEGRANITFTMQDFTGDRVAILATAKPCWAAGAYFERRTVTPTPVRTPIAETETPTAVPTTPAVTVTATPPTPTQPPATPKPPVAGTGSGGFGSTGMNLALVGLTLVMFCGAFAIWGSTRRTKAARAYRGNGPDAHG